MPRCFRHLSSVPLFVALTLTSVTALACDTPVYRYAMYRWEPAPYEVYHFHNGAMDEGFQAASEKLANARNEKIAPANVAVYPVDVAKDPELKTVPRDVRRIWEAKQKENVPTPLTLVVNPQGVEVFAGELPSDNVSDLVLSPTRKEVGQLLAKGHAGVFVLVLGKDAAQNKTASEAVDKLIGDVNSGKLSLYTGPEAVDPLDVKLPGDEEKPRRNAPKREAANKPVEEEANTEKKDKADKRAHSAAALKFTREQLQSKDPWLLRSLMAVEGDLDEFAGEPMLFVIYGRGRALPPYIGKGIVYENLVEVTDFITSACSCTVKDQNPGVDLLMAFDWVAASAAVAERFGSEEGNNESLTDLFPQLIIPGGKDLAEPKKEEPRE